MTSSMPDSTPSTSTSRPDGLFATTLWTVVLQAGGTGTTQSRQALERLCQTYWYPIYAHARRRGHSPHDAQDLVQSFFAALIERRQGVIYVVMASLAILSGFYCISHQIHLLVWDKRFSVGDFVGAVIFSTIPFTWMGSLLLWRLVTYYRAHVLGLETQEASRHIRVKVAKSFWFVLASAFGAFYLLALWFIPSGKFQPLPLFTSQGHSDAIVRDWFMMLASCAALIVVTAAVGILKSGVGRLGFLFLSLVLLLLCPSILALMPGTTGWSAFLLGLAGGSLLLVAGRFRKE